MGILNAVNSVFGNGNQSTDNNTDAFQEIQAISRSLARIEFDVKGNILDANDNFLNTVGYSLSEIKNQHHSMFVEAEYAKSSEYAQFWRRLERGEFFSDRFKRIAKNGKGVWIQASYNPILDQNGRPYKVVKYATDITEQKAKSAELTGIMCAIDKSQAKIEFELDGTIITANDNFLDAVGYALNDIVGKHHSMFTEPEYAASSEYRMFWKKLGNGEFDSGEYKRVGRGGKEIWINATYNPIFDDNGKPFKVVKIASDVTQQKLKDADYSGQIQAISKSQAVIEFSTDGIILNANQNFLDTVGYSLDEIKGKHHSIFVKSEYAHSSEYRAFWEKLKSGQFDTGQYERVGKNGKPIWIQASYNAILGLNGKPTKVVKYASNITDRLETFNELNSALQEMANGDLTAKVNVCKDSEYKSLADNLNSFGDSLKNMVSSILESAQAVSEGATQIEEGNNNLSRRTEQQAASLEQTAASMDEITSTVKQTAENVNRANQLVSSTQDSALKGGEVVGKAIEAMGEINNSSNRIAEIIGVIDEIAFQTNLLALNASVEAARAGEQGRGFAVVASEVRNLASRSATAAKEIKELIEDSVSKVKDGSELVSRSGDTLNTIVDGVQDVTKIVSEIAVAADEQSIGVGEVLKAIEQLQLVTQQNTALVEEAAAASEELSHQASSLNDSMSVFQCDDGSSFYSLHDNPLRNAS